MCAIFGYCGLKDNFNQELFNKLRLNAGDRGRDGGRVEKYDLCDGYLAVLGQWRATPEMEVVSGREQPYDAITHNGAIWNSIKLGQKEGEVDSEVLPRILNRKSLIYFAKSLEQIVGSYAIACRTPCSVFAATNYKPLHYWSPNEKDVYFSSMERHFHDIVPFGTRPAVVEPYSCIDFRRKGIIILPRSEGEPPNALVAMSSGLDSTVVVADLIARKFNVGLLNFQYGSRAEKIESQYVQNIANYYGIPCHTMQLDFQQMKGQSAIMTPDKQIAGAEGMKYAFEWVPARNLVMLANATAFAEANGYHYIALGNNISEASACPDNEEQFTYLLSKVLDYAVKANYKLKLVTPLGHLTKTEIVKKGIALHVPFWLSYSCYEGTPIHCGRCASCRFRQLAFKRAGWIDPVEYTSLPETDFWKDCKQITYRQELKELDIEKSCPYCGDIQTYLNNEWVCLRCDSGLF